MSATTNTTAGDTAAKAVHPVDEKPPLSKLFFFGLQHVLAMYAGAVAVPLIVGGAMVQAGELQPGDIPHLIVADLFVAGIASVIQTIGFWRFGARLPVIQGVSFVAVAPMIAIGSQHGITAIYGSVIACGIMMMLLAPVFGKIVKYFPPLVTGTIMTCIGLSLISVPAGWITNANGPADKVGSAENFFLAIVALVTVIVIHRFASAQWRPMAVLGGVLVGTIVGQFIGATNWSKIGDANWVGLPEPFMFGFPTFEVASIFTMLIVGLVIMTETSSDIIAIGNITGRRANKRILSDGLRADGLSTMLGGIFNTFPYAAFAQNVGLISLSRVFSRYVVAVSGVILVLLGLLPKMGAAVSSVPMPVLGGAGVALFGMVTASGIRTLSTIDWTEGRTLIVGVSITISALPSVAPGFYDHMPDTLGMVLHSGITAGAICVIVMNLLLNREDGGHMDESVLMDELEDSGSPSGAA
ncbi:nucleobase:cation symporter-2 family protein [Corynebacterium anserum]|uniref:Purine permease n=1 Tax=Corynebacterium anserum TaxID=2684406 RepID=A0A7G7YQ99_9CORY|nr:nucleobase:cation symporter-2 family protein [Corynebacterium anserum]MBC2682348.1 purine permease [Corynebacterium anserum]QNH96669.1 purine permease [Corynebacterium anserum]